MTTTKPFELVQIVNDGKNKLSEIFGNVKPPISKRNDKLNTPEITDATVFSNNVLIKIIIVILAFITFFRNGNLFKKRKLTTKIKISKKFSKFKLSNLHKRNILPINNV